LQIAGLMCLIAAFSVLLLRKPGSAALTPQAA
jgi:hypothetical protein